MIEDYKSKLQDNTYALRIGKEVPEGDVNLSYIHTPKVQSDENISLINTTYISDNVIPQDQLESIVVANAQGELEYVDMIGNGEVRSRPPSNTFPSRKINLTRKFKKNDMRTENALYYKIEIDYHYDSKMALPNDEGKYLLAKYTGQQIELTDENGNLLDDTYKYDIYVQPQALNPRIYSVRIYLHQNTNKVESFKVRYNHIDNIVKDEHVMSVQHQVEFYTNKDNTIVVNNQSKQMLEGGKLRIINGVSALDEKPEAEVQQAIAQNNSGREIFAVVPKDNGEGYKIIVPQRSEADPRAPRIFSHRVVAGYTGTDGQQVKVTVGHITDWYMNPEALLKNEREEYSGDWKNIGMPTGGGKLNAKEMIEFSLPFGTPSIPADAVFFIEDDNGNLMYHIKTLTDNATMDTRINEAMSQTIEAKGKSVTQIPWKNAMQDNAVVKSNPISHLCSVIPEHQQTEFDFTWKADGQGRTEASTNYKTNWQVCANIGFKKTVNPKTLDLLDKNKWATIGNNSDVDKWKYSYVPEIGKSVIEYLENADDVMGFYQRQEMIDGEMTNMMSKTDYQFSTKVRLTDPVDDDMIGIMFRVRDSKNYYMFAWEKNEISTANKTYTKDHGEGIVGTVQGCGRIVLDEYGYGIRSYQPAGGATESWRWTNDKDKYLNQMGFKNNHKRMFKVTPSSKSASADPTQTNVWNGSTRYPMDKTASQFEDITDLNSTYNAKGWEYGKDYKITVVVTGTLFRVYINGNVDSSELGELVCQGTDSTHNQGSYGIFCVSQRWTYWYDLMMTEIFLDSVCTGKKDVTLTDTSEKKLSNYTVTDMMEPLIKQLANESFNGAPYEVFNYLAESDGDFTLRIDKVDDFLYGRTNSASAGGLITTPWKTSDNGLTVNGTGKVKYHPDGHFTIVVNPSKLPSEQVPSDVLGFTWNQPTLLTGENVKITLASSNGIKVTATVPPIKLIGKPYVLNESEIVKSEELKHLEYLFDKEGREGFYKKLNIPESIPRSEILLRIERGRVTGVSENGIATTENPEHRVNYRFRCQKGGFTRLPVDQFQDQLGVNRLRLDSILTEKGTFDSSIEVEVVAWTTFQELEAVPLFAIKVEEERKVEIEKPKIEHHQMEVDNWYLRVKNGRFLKRVILPYHEIDSVEKPPEIYVSYPELLGMVKKPEDIVEVDLEYSLPEYTNQEFHNDSLALIDKESPMILNEYAIQTRYAPLVLQSETGMSYLEVYSIRGSQRRSLRISDVDAAKGIIYLHDRIREQDEVAVRYAYREDWYTYRGFYKEIIMEELPEMLSMKTIERADVKMMAVCDMVPSKTSIDVGIGETSERITVTTGSNTSGVASYYIQSMLPVTDYSNPSIGHFEYDVRPTTEGNYAVSVIVKFNDGQQCSVMTTVRSYYPTNDLVLTPKTVYAPVGNESIRMIASYANNKSGVKSYKWTTANNLEVQLNDHSNLVENRFEASFTVLKANAYDGWQVSLELTFNDGQVINAIGFVLHSYPSCDIAISKSLITANVGVESERVKVSYSNNTSGIKSVTWSNPEYGDYREGNGIVTIKDYSDYTSGTLEFGFISGIEKEYNWTLHVDYKDGQRCSKNLKFISAYPVCDLTLSESIISSIVGVDTTRVTANHINNTSGVESFQWGGLSDAVTVKDYSDLTNGKLEFAFASNIDGIYNAVLTVTYKDGQSCKSPIMRISITNPQCDLMLSSRKEELHPGETTKKITASFSSNTSGIKTIEWVYDETLLKMNNTSVLEENRIEVAFTALKGGSDTVKLRVTYNSGQTCMAALDIISTYLPCSLALTASSGVFRIEKTAIIGVIHGNHSGVTSFVWSLSDGLQKDAVETGDELVIVGVTTGQKTIALTVTYEDGQECSASIQVMVEPAVILQYKYFHLDLNPTSGHRYTVAHNGFHQWIPMDIDQEVFTIPQEENSSTELLVKQIHIYLRPSMIRYVSHTNKALHGKPIAGTKKKKVIFHTDEEWWFNPKDYKHDQTLFRLGKVMLQANSTLKENMTILDTRTRGGGLDESLSKEIIRQVNEESMYHWDIGYFDGEAYQENGVFIMRLPRSILKSDTNPKGFHETDVQQAVAKHKAYGVLPVIEYYDEVRDDNQYNIIPNPEFLYNKHIGYHDPVRSVGQYELRNMQMGSGDNHVLQLTGNAEYAITIPGYKFKSNEYRIEIKALKEQSAPARSAGTVDVYYKDGSVRKTQLGLINSSQWVTYKESLGIDENVHHVTITLNKTTEIRTGRIIVDHVMLHPTPNISEETTETHEI